jgi:hypothetical protein
VKRSQQAGGSNRKPPGASRRECSQHLHPANAELVLRATRVRVFLLTDSHATLLSVAIAAHVQPKPASLCLLLQ